MRDWCKWRVDRFGREGRRTVDSSSGPWPCRHVGGRHHSWPDIDGTGHDVGDPRRRNRGCDIGSGRARAVLGNSDRRVSVLGGLELGHEYIPDGGRRCSRNSMSSSELGFVFSAVVITLGLFPTVGSRFWLIVSGRRAGPRLMKAAGLGPAREAHPGRIVMLWAAFFTALPVLCLFLLFLWEAVVQSVWSSDSRGGSSLWVGASFCGDQATPTKADDKAPRAVVGGLGVARSWMLHQRVRVRFDGRIRAGSSSV